MSKFYLNSALQDIKDIKLAQTEAELYALAKTRYHYTTHEGYPSCRGKLPPLRDVFSHGLFTNGIGSEFHTSLWQMQRDLIAAGEIEEYVEIALHGEVLNMKGER